MADWDGMSRAFSFKLCTYLIWSMMGMRMFKPWRREGEEWEWQVVAISSDYPSKR